MSLVELLVVVAILGMLAVTVLPNLSNTAEARRSREAARSVSSFVAKAQSRAIGKTSWSGFMLVATNSTSYVASDLLIADVPAVYRGDTVPATLQITGSISDTVREATGNQGQLTLSGTNGANVQPYDLIRFAGRDPWYEISGTMTGTSVRFRIRGDLSGNAAGQMELSGATRHNTPWPPFSAPLGMGTNPLSFEILRQAGGIGSPVSLQGGRCIDLYWSGYGPPTVNGSFGYKRFETGTTGIAAAGATTTILFDGTGRVRQLQVRSGSTLKRLAVTGPIFLLVGRADRAGQNSVPGVAAGNDDSIGANWQYPDSFWIAVDPNTGSAKEAQCKANAAELIDSQEWIRDALTAGGG
jgi:type II secretory pathway pseudopilin PulG